MAHYLGCSGWYYRHWRDSFYEGIEKSKWFNHYAEVFNTVELNSTFYRFPREKTAEGWYKKSPEDFVYTLKANKSITHTKKFKGTKNLVRDFYRVADVLGEKLGCILFQLPPSLHYSEKKLMGMLDQLDREKKNVFEFRHRSWWNENVYEMMKEQNIIFCIVSGPKLPEEFVKTAEDIYLRFHGKKWYRYNYSEEELRGYAEKIEKMQARNIWCYFNNDFNAYSVDNCSQLRDLLEKGL
ncbi:MAG: DUF72 domain-containing protein [Thermoplasmata archaeon]